MDKEPNKNSSELYREKRKERLAKAEEKKGNKPTSPDKKNHKVKASVIISIVLVVALISGFLINFFGVPKRMTTALTTSDGTKISVAEYEYYYRYFLTSYHSTSAQYESAYQQYYGEGAGVMMTGYDANKTPENQKYTLSELDKDKYGKNPTWADYFESLSIQSCYMNRDLAQKAIKAGMKITDDDKKELNEYIKDIRETAAENNYSLDAYLRQNFGKGMNEKLLREIFENQTLAEKYSNSKQKEFEDSITDETVNKEYNENKDDYDVVDIRMFYLSSTAASDESDKKTDEELKAETKKSAEETKANIQKMFDGVKDEASFVSQAYAYASESSKDKYKEDSATLMSATNKSNITSYVSEDAAKWVYDDSRVAGDRKIFTKENEDGSVTCYVLYVVNPAYRDDTPQPVDVRHILVSFDDNTEDDKDVTVTDELKAKKLQEAEKLLKTWKDGKATEDTFSELAKKNSDDTGSAEDGGLIEDISKSSNYVKPFLNWCFESGRKSGDTGIVESTYGYHIMYCVSVADKAEWQNTITSSLVEEKYNDYFNDYLEKADKKVVLKDKKIAKVRSSMEKIAGRMIANS